MRPKLKKLLWIAPLALVGILLLVAIGGTIVMLLWNGLLPALFGWPPLTFGQALGLLVLCRILFGGSGSHRGFRSCLRHRIRERCGDMTDEERERFRERMRERWGEGALPRQTEGQ